MLRAAEGVLSGSWCLRRRRLLLDTLVIQKEEQLRSLGVEGREAASDPSKDLLGQGFGREARGLDLCESGSTQLIAKGGH